MSGLRNFGQGAIPAAWPTFPPVAAQTPVAATAAVWTLPAVAGAAWMVSGVRWSYSATPTGGQLTIAWTDPTAGAVSEVYAITAGGPGYLPLNKAFPPDTAVTFTLASGAGSVVGTVYGDAILD